MSTAKYKLISFSLCPYVQRARAILNEKNIEHEIEFIDLDSPPDWFFDISPMEKVPVLLVDDKPLFESLAICEYLDEITPNSLHPEDPFLKAQNRAWIEFGNTLLSLTYDFLLTEDELKFKQLTASVDEKFDILEEDCLTGTPYFNGSSFAIIDAVFAPVFKYHNAIEKYHDFNFYDERPNVVLWRDTLLKHQAVIDSVPESYNDEMDGYFQRLESVFSQYVKKD